MAQFAAVLTARGRSKPRPYDDALRFGCLARVWDVFTLAGAASGAPTAEGLKIKRSVLCKA